MNDIGRARETESVLLQGVQVNFAIPQLSDELKQEITDRIGYVLKQELENYFEVLPFEKYVHDDEYKRNKQDTSLSRVINNVQVEYYKPTYFEYYFLHDEYTLVFINEQPNTSAPFLFGEDRFLKTSKLLAAKYSVDSCVNVSIGIKPKDGLLVLQIRFVMANSKGEYITFVYANLDKGMDVLKELPEEIGKYIPKINNFDRVIRHCLYIKDNVALAKFLKLEDSSVFLADASMSPQEIINLRTDWPVSVRESLIDRIAELDQIYGWNHPQLTSNDVVNGVKFIIRKFFAKIYKEKK